MLTHFGISQQYMEFRLLPTLGLPHPPYGCMNHVQLFPSPFQEVIHNPTLKSNIIHIAPYRYICHRLPRQLDCSQISVQET